MFLIISNKDRVRAGAELREKNPRWRLWGIVLLFKNFSLLFFFAGGDHTEGRQGGTTTLGLDWVIQEKTPSCPVPMPERKKQQQHQQQKKPQPTWNYAQTPLCEPGSAFCQDPSSGHTRLVRLHVEPTSQKSFPKSLSFLLVGFKTTSVTNRRVFDTLNHDRLQEVSQFRYALVYYYHIYIFMLFFYFVFAELLIFLFQ